ncbi:MAG TPA: DUF6036 family nucleotidyltransferase, partial [Opitutaceae bacterium]|nr:DUF6036 family nucleotidyltransferase [Opitutaceae bacterium]
MKHLIAAVQGVAASERIRVLGSSALLARFPELGEANGPLEKTFDADLLIEPCDEQLAAVLHEAVGDGSLFAQRTGYHADILRHEIVATLPPQWEARVVVIDPIRDVAALAPEDLMIVKLRAGRPKDLGLCRDLIDRKLITASALRQRLDATPLDEREI